MRVSLNFANDGAKVKIHSSRTLGGELQHDLQSIKEGKVQPILAEHMEGAADIGKIC